MEKTERIKQLSDRIQFLGVITLFFPTLLQSLFKFLGNSDKEADKILVQWSLVVFLFLMNYLLFDARKDKLTPRMIDYLNWSIFFNIASFAFLILFFGFMTNETFQISSVYLFFYSFALVSLIASPVITGLVFLSTFAIDIWGDLKSISKTLKEKRAK